MNDEFQAELGFSLIKSIFGTCSEQAPNIVQQATHDSTWPSSKVTRPYSHEALDYPQDNFYRGYAASFNENKNWPNFQIHERYSVPTKFAAQFQLTEFWDKVHAQYGAMALRSPRCLKVDTIYLSKLGMRKFSVRKNKDQSEGLLGNRELDEPYQRVLADLEERENLYRTIRPWYADACKAPPPFILSSFSLRQRLTG